MLGKCEEFAGTRQRSEGIFATSVLVNHYTETALARLATVQQIQAL